MKGGLRAAPAVGVTAAVSSRTGSLTGPPDERAELVRVPGPAVTGTGQVVPARASQTSTVAYQLRLPRPMAAYHSSGQPSRRLT